MKRDEGKKGDEGDRKKTLVLQEQVEHLKREEKKNGTRTRKRRTSQSKKKVEEKEKRKMKKMD